MTYPNIYVGQISLGANMMHTIKVFNEAENMMAQQLSLLIHHV